MAVLGFIVMTLMLGGCVGVYYPEQTQVFVEQGKGIYHTVEEGQTLWSISQLYHVDIEQLVAVNGMPNAAVIKEGQKIFIPGAQREIRSDRLVYDPDQDIFAWPLDGRVTSYFGSGRADHWGKGVCIENSAGRPVKAVRRGEVVFSDRLPGYGPTVMIDHKDGLLSVYANNADVTVDLGDVVSKGDSVAATKAGRDAFLYFEIRRDGSAVNPLFYLPKY